VAGRDWHASMRTMRVFSVTFKIRASSALAILPSTEKKIASEKCARCVTEMFPRLPLWFWSRRLIAISADAPDATDETLAHDVPGAYYLEGASSGYRPRADGCPRRRHHRVAAARPRDARRRARCPRRTRQADVASTRGEATDAGRAVQSGRYDRRLHRGLSHSRRGGADGGQDAADAAAI
jgi:hypothetical protein